MKIHELSHTVKMINDYKIRGENIQIICKNNITAHPKDSEIFLYSIDHLEKKILWPITNIPQNNNIFTMGNEISLVIKYKNKTAFVSIDSVEKITFSEEKGKNPENDILTSNGMPRTLILSGIIICAGFIVGQWMM